MSDVLERKYVKLVGRIAEARVNRDWQTMIAAKYDLDEVKNELGM